MKQSYLITEFQTKLLATFAAIELILVRMHRDHVSRQRNLCLVLLIAKLARIIIEGCMRFDVIVEMRSGAERIAAYRTDILARIVVRPQMHF